MIDSPCREQGKKCFSMAFQILDLCHAVEHLCALTKLLEAQPDAAKALWQGWREQLLADEVDEVLRPAQHGLPNLFCPAPNSVAGSDYTFKRVRDSLTSLNISQSEVNKGPGPGAATAGRSVFARDNRRPVSIASQIPARTDNLRGATRERGVPLRGRLTKDAADCCIARFLVLAAEDSERPIIVHVASSGGLASQALAVISTMKGIRCPIATFSAGAVVGPAIAIAARGAKGFRAALPGTRFSFAEFGSEGGPAAGGDSLLAVIAEILAHVTAKSAVETLEWIRSGASFTAQEALRNGLIDSIANEPALPKFP